MNSNSPSRSTKVATTPHTGRSKLRMGHLLEGKKLKEESVVLTGLHLSPISSKLQRPEFKIPGN